jgi:hypothetical protein
MHFYFAILLRTLAALAVTVAVVIGIGQVLETADPVWLPAAVVNLVLAYALWRLAGHVLARGAETEQIPF